MARRLALLVGNSRFKDERDFPNLHTPCSDARDLAEVLQHHGHFEILDLLLDAAAEQVRLAVENLYAQAQRGDLTLLYYSGHGYKDIAGRLFLAAADTQIINNKVTRGVSETFIQEGMSTSDSRHKVVILDCCFSGAFIGGEKAPANEALVLERMKGEATAILASSGRIQYSFEEQGCNSLFTKYLLQGITSGEADEDGDGIISVSELFDYTDLHVRQARPEQTPVIELSAREGQLVIAETPPERMETIRKQHQLDALYKEACQAVDEQRWSEAQALLKEMEDLQPTYADTPLLRERVEAEIARLEQNTDLAAAVRALITNPLPVARLGAVYELEKLLSSRFPRLVQLAFEELQRLSEDDSRRVCEAARAVLERHASRLGSEFPAPLPPQKAQEVPNTPPSQVPTLQAPPPEDRCISEDTKKPVRQDFISTQVKPIFNATINRITSTPMRWSVRGRRYAAQPEKGFVNRIVPWMVLGFAVIVLLGIIIWGAARQIKNKASFNVLPNLAASGGNSIDLYFTSNRDGKNDIYRLDHDGNTTRVTNSPEGAESGEPALASDGALYFGSSRQNGNAWEIYRLDPDGKTIRVTNSPDGSVSWGALPIQDGEFYFGSNRNGKVEIYNMEPGGNVIRITNSPADSASWGHTVSRSGELYFTSNRDGQNDIYRMGKDGKTVRVTNSTKGESWRPSLAQDGSIYFTSNRSGKAEIYHLETSGKIIQITHTPEFYESWTPVIVQDGSLYFTSNRGAKIEIFYLDDTEKTEQVTHSPGNSGSWLNMKSKDG